MCLSRACQFSNGFLTEKRQFPGCMYHISAKYLQIVRLITRVWVLNRSSKILSNISKVDVPHIFLLFYSFVQICSMVIEYQVQIFTIWIEIYLQISNIFSPLQYKQPSDVRRFLKSALQTQSLQIFHCVFPFTLSYLVGRILYETVFTY